MTAVFHQAFPDRKALGLNVPEAVLIVGETVVITLQLGRISRA
ncbi:MAG: hypothetical protein ACLR2E_19965 [Lachnospiraceae bacterium]